jgi:TRAP-type mannitol/chloroaromatic compound transport system permease small subunit
VQRFEAVIAGISLWMARFGGVLLVLASIIITVEILARKFFFLPFNTGTELSTYALAAAGSWSFSYALIHRAHVRIDVVRNLFGQRMKAALDVLAMLSLAALALVLARYTFDTVETSWSLGARENTPLGTPLILPQGLWFIGLVWFAFVCIEQTVVVLFALLRGQISRVLTVAGPPGMDEELQEALAAVEPHVERIG